MNIENKSPEQTEEAKAPSLDESFEYVQQERDQQQNQEVTDKEAASPEKTGEDSSLDDSFEYVQQERDQQQEQEQASSENIQGSFKEASKEVTGTTEANKEETQIEKGGNGEGTTDTGTDTGPSPGGTSEKPNEDETPPDDYYENQEIQKKQQEQEQRELDEQQKLDKQQELDEPTPERTPPGNPNQNKRNPTPGF